MRILSRTDRESAERAKVLSKAPSLRGSLLGISRGSRVDGRATRRRTARGRGASRSCLGRENLAPFRRVANARDPERINAGARLELAARGPRAMDAHIRARAR